MKTHIFLLLLLLLTACQEVATKTASNEHTATAAAETDSSATMAKVQVLNFATFHMGTTSDANSVDFDENDRKNQNDAKKIAQMIAKFKPTIICVEVPLEMNAELNEVYTAYLADSSQTSTYYGEVGMVAFEVARLSRLKTLYAIDHKLEYNYLIGQEIENAIDSTTYNAYSQNPYAYHPAINVDHDSLSLLEKLKLYNHPQFLDLLINYNADMLAFAGTENGYEGADEAAKYYKRNLRIYSNLNRIPMTPEDRVFILSGGSHTAFLGEFMARSPKYELVAVPPYLKE